MPGPVSDTYDPEWGTAANAEEIREALRQMYAKVSALLGNSKPVYILDLLASPPNGLVTETFTDKDWRVIRFALERATESI